MAHDFEQLTQYARSFTHLTSEDEALLEAAIGKAIRYTLNQWDYLVRYLEDGNLQIDNNAAERRIKPFVIGRKKLY
jgi:hypothetical protein